MELSRKLIFLIVLCFFILDLEAQFSINLGKDTTYCIPVLDLETTFLGTNLVIENGQPPYTYLWECDVKVGSTGFYTASDFLNDTTISTPFFIDKYPVNKWIRYILTISDNLNRISKDTIYVRFSNFAYSIVTTMISFEHGDSVYFDGIKYIGGGIPPLQITWEPKTGLTDTTNLNTWCKPDMSTNYYQIAIDSCGCISVPNLVYIIEISSTGIQDQNKEYNNEFVTPIQKNSKIFFINPQMKEAFISIYNLNGQNLLNIKTKADSMELGNLIQRQGIYVIRVVIENKMGDVKYFKY